ncbi:MAG: hypothetical protein KAQ98_12135 [Bacteriovoracaceae bacterium]|nr:hypothetical protein [Bacteriovoracaceae bacterium]
MKTLVLVISLLSVLPAFSHLYTGKYQGVTPEGKTCEFIIKDIAIHDNIYHPFNQKITLSYNDREFFIQVTPEVDVSNNKISYNAYVLTGANGTIYGEEAFVLYFNNEDKHHGPNRAVILTDDYRLEEVKKIKCNNLSYTW